MVTPRSACPFERAQDCMYGLLVLLLNLEMTESDLARDRESITSKRYGAHMNIQCSPTRRS